MAKSGAVDLTTHELRREEKGVVLTVNEGDDRFGELVVSKGGLRWRASGEHDHHFMTWEDVDRTMRNYPKR